jgi:antitoxin component YwqK of YwqJK toxin-antitoxin module
MVRKTLNGLRVGHYENGSLEYKLNYKNGKRHGLGEHYFWAGQLWWKGEYKNSKERGLWYEFRQD